MIYNTFTVLEVHVFVLCQFEVKEQVPADAPPGNVVSTPEEVEEVMWGQQSSSKATAALCKEDQEERCNMQHFRCQMEYINYMLTCWRLLFAAFGYSCVGNFF